MLMGMWMVSTFEDRTYSLVMTRIRIPTLVLFCPFNSSLKTYLGVRSTARAKSVPIPWGKTHGFPLWLHKSTFSVTAQLSLLGMHMRHAVPLLIFNVTTLWSVKFDFNFFQDCWCSGVLYDDWLFECLIWRNSYATLYLLWRHLFFWKIMSFNYKNCK